MKNICRPFILYNNFLSSSENKDNLVMYTSFGYYDGLTIGKNLFVNNRIDLRKMWKFYVNQTNNLNGSYSSQIIYGFRSEQQDNKKDEKFWRYANQKKYPFLFMSLIQFGQICEDKRKSSLKELEKKIEECTSCKAITYLTVDHSDMILFLLCEKYNDGAELIDSFHISHEEIFQTTMGRKIGYCFTVASIRTTILNDSNVCSKMKEPIDSVYIHLIEKEAGSIENINKEIDDTGKDWHKSKESIFGCNDEILVLKGISWSEFLEFYKTDGCLNHTSKFYKDNFIGVTTTIGIPQDESKRSYQNYFEKNREEFQNLSIDNKQNLSATDELLERCKNIKIYGDDIKKNFCYIISSLHKFENKQFSSYVYDFAIEAVKMAVEISEEASTKDIDTSDMIFWCYEFIKGFYMFIQNANHPERQFTQTPEISIRVYDTPIKLMALYNTYVSLLKKYLNRVTINENSDQHEYAFLLCPGVTGSTQVLELFKGISESKKLFFIEVSEHQLYNPKLMYIMLGHEVAHLVGTKLRNRKFRFERALKITARILVKYMEGEISNILKEKGWEKLEEEIITEDIFIRVEEKIFDNLKDFTSDDSIRELLRKKFNVNKKTPEQIENLIEAIVNRKQYSFELNYILPNGLRAFCEEYGRIIWKEVLERANLYWVKNGDENRKNNYNYLEQSIFQSQRELLTKSIWNRTNFSVETSIRKVMDIFKECFADLVNIITLNMSFSDYVDTLCQCSVEQGYSLKSTTDSFWLMRWGLVTTCMMYSDDTHDLGEGWKEIAFDQNDLSREKRKVYTMLENFRDYCSIEDFNSSNSNKMIHSINVLYDWDILGYILEYLLKCREDLNKNWEKIEASKGINDERIDLRKMYDLFEKGDIEDILRNMAFYFDKK